MTAWILACFALAVAAGPDPASALLFAGICYLGTLILS